MKTLTGLFVIVLAALIVLTIIPPSREPVSMDAPRATVYKVSIHANTEERPVVGWGSGVMIAPFTMLTAAHVAADYSGRPQLNISVGDDYRPAKVLKIDRNKDVALLQVALGCPCAPLAAIETRDHAVVAIGYPLSNILKSQIVTTGTLAGELWRETERTVDLGDNYTIVVKERVRFLIATAPIAPGNSGSGLFAYDGRRWLLIGLTVAVPNAGDFTPVLVMHLPIVVPGATLMEFVK